MSNTNLATLEYAEKSGEALKAAQELAQSVVSSQEKVAAAVPSRVNLLHEHKLITEDEKQAAAEQLSNHEGALNVIGNLIQVNAETKQAYEQKIAELNQKLAAAGFGEEDSPTKTASQRSRGAADDLSSGGYVGQRTGSQIRPSDAPLLKAAGIHK